MNETLKDIVESGLFINLLAIVAQLTSTVILFFFLKRLVWKPMQEFLGKRQEVIVGELESAKAARIEAESMKVEYESDLKNAKAEASQIIEHAKSQALETKASIVKEAEKEAAYKLERAEKEIEQERQTAAKELKSHVVDIAFVAAEKLVQNNLDEKKNRQLIDQFIEEVGE